MDGRDYYLGEYGSAQAEEKYQRMIGEWLLRGKQGPAVANHDTVTVGQIMAGYLEHCQRYFGRIPTVERSMCRWLKEHYATTPAKDFGPLALSALRIRMTKSKVMVGGNRRFPSDRNLSRKYVNALTFAVVRMFRWAAQNELVPGSIYMNLRALGSLEHGRSEARETQPVRPVEEKHMNAALKHAEPMLAAMIRFQYYTACRPGEVCRLRGIDIDTSDPDCWVYRPPQHKTAYRGIERAILIGPEARAAIEPYLKADLHSQIFTIRDAYVEKFIASPPSYSHNKGYARVKIGQKEIHLGRWKSPESYQKYTRLIREYTEHPERIPISRRYRNEYDEKTYYHAIRRLCRDARIPHWKPHQLRHAGATRLAHEFGTDVARVILGHTEERTTRVYVAPDWQRAKDVIRKIG
jgi:integrase